MPEKLLSWPGHVASLDPTPALLDGLGCGTSPLPGPTGPLSPFPTLLRVLGGQRRPGSSPGGRGPGLAVPDPAPQLPRSPPHPGAAVAPPCQGTGSSGAGVPLQSHALGFAPHPVWFPQTRCLCIGLCFYLRETGSPAGREGRAPLPGTAQAGRVTSAGPRHRAGDWRVWPLQDGCGELGSGRH